MQDALIVSLTSYGNRVNNIPVVLDTIFSQTVLPDVVVLNLAFEENVPDVVADYLEEHKVEINRVMDTRVYKKLIPTLIKYPEACVISIDDDFLYPKGMIEDFVRIHEKYPNYPISGNRVVYFGMQCHCGCASLTKAEFLGDYLHQLDAETIANCPSDDMLYTYFATKNGHPYVQTEKEYFINMQGLNDGNDKGYSDAINGDEGIVKSYDYLVNRFGLVDNVVSSYIHDDYMARVIETIHRDNIWEVEDRIRSSRAYRIGKSILKPFSWLNKRWFYDLHNHLF